MYNKRKYMGAGDDIDDAKTQQNAKKEPKVK